LFSSDLKPIYRIAPAKMIMVIPPITFKKEANPPVMTVEAGTLASANPARTQAK